tara:strand:+ start:812 stop:1669 length:858 start_codon:yes stop_codon:yes gene_type:complete
LNYSKSLDTLVEDIYKAIDGLSENKDISISEEIAEEFGNKIKEALLHWATPRNQEQGLRMSNIGKPSRQLWYDMKLKAEPKKVHPSVQIKFLYGHLLEEVLLMLTKLAGHTVEDEQKEVTVSGIKGHIDCKIDGEVVDIKSASKFAFKKFEEGTLGESDSFGYLAQLAGYEKALKTNEGGFLVINKETGELCLFRPDDLDKPNVTDKIKLIKKELKIDSPPERCYNPIPEGVKGNMKLPKECSWCNHKFECHSDANEGEGLRVFLYSKGPVYFTKVVSTPKVQEA